MHTMHKLDDHTKVSLVCDHGYELTHHCHCLCIMPTQTKNSNLNPIVVGALLNFVSNMIDTVEFPVDAVVVFHLPTSHCLYNVNPVEFLFTHRSSIHHAMVLPYA